MPSPLRIAVDARTASGAFTGIGRYTSELVSAMARLASDVEMLVIVTESAHAGFRFLKGPRVELYPTAMETSRHPGGDLWLQLRVPCLMRQRSIDILFSCANFLPAFTLGTRRVLTIHDMGPFLHPGQDPKKFALYLSAMIRMGAAVADRIIADSHSVAREITQILGVDAKRIDVVPLGVTELFQPLPDGQYRHELPTKAPYLLGVGSRIPRKNFCRLVEALGMLRAGGLPHELILAGPPGHGDRELAESIARSGLQSAVHIVGYPEDRQLVELYNRAAVFVYPSLYEGFGIPVLESMACGTPVACANVSSIPEVAGDAALMFDPGSTEAIAEACRRIVTDGRTAADLRARGLERVKLFTYEATAKRMLEIFRSLVGTVT